MNEKTLLILMAILGGFIGILVEIGVGSKSSSFIRKASFSIIGIVISTLGTTCIFMQKDFLEIREGIESVCSANKYVSAINSTSNIESPIVQDFFSERLKQIDSSLGEIMDKSILIPREEILNTWEKIIRNADDYVWATNLVCKEDWKHVSRDNAGIKVQKDAIEGGVSITRIMLYDENTPNHKEGLERLKKLQEDAGIKVYELPLTWIDDNETYLKSKQRLQTADIVLVDDTLLLLTTVNSSYKMEYAYLTYDKSKIDTAKNLLKKLLEEMEYEKGGDNAK